MAYPVAAEQKEDARPGANAGCVFTVIGKRRLRVFIRQVAMLMEEGLPVHRALGMLKELADNPKHSHMVGKMIQRIHEGEPLSNALFCFGWRYTPAMRECLRFAEDSGDPHELTVALRLIAGDLCVRPSASIPAPVFDERPVFRIYEE